MDDAVDVITTSIGSPFVAENSSTGEKQTLNIIINKEVEVHDNLVFVGFETQATVDAKSKLKIGDTIEDTDTCEKYEISRLVSETKSKLVFGLTER